PNDDQPGSNRVRDWHGSRAKTRCLQSEFCGDADGHTRFVYAVTRGGSGDPRVNPVRTGFETGTVLVPRPAVLRLHAPRCGGSGDPRVNPVRTGFEIGTVLVPETLTQIRARIRRL